MNGTRPLPGPFAIPRPAMRGRYLIRNRAKALAIAALDAILSALPRDHGTLPAEPERILVANWGHLGDVITTLGAIAALRERFPGVRIGMIVGSWGRAAVADTGLVDKIHVVDHWAANRRTETARQKRRRFRETRATALKAIRAEHYQIGIDFYPFFPPAHPLFRKAGIPVRIGFDSGGFGPLLSHAASWHDRPIPMAEQYRSLLTLLNPDFLSPAVSLRPQRDRTSLGPTRFLGSASYVVLHPGAGAAYKDWGLQNWRDLMILLATRLPEHRLVLTGAGAAESATTAKLADNLDAVTDMSGRADWPTFVSIVADADLVICPDTATGHVAALFDVPVVSIFTGTNVLAQWAPYTERNITLVKAVSCAPCHRAGCEAMVCVREVSPKQVLSSALSLLSTLPLTTAFPIVEDDTKR